MERKGRLEVEAGQHTDKGKVRERNEDFLSVPPPWVDSATLQTKGMLYVVADGVGGHAAGLTASRTAVERTVQEYYGDSDPDMAQSLGRAIRVANDAILQQADEDPAFSGMGSTLVAAVLRGDELLVANLGDSRAYLVRGRSTRQISRDHTWVQEQVDAGSITPKEARTHPRKNVITRSLGVSPDLRVDFFAERLRAGDKILLCTDGICGPVSDEEISQTLRKNEPQRAVKRLVDLANERGGFDNSTAVAIGVLQTPSSAGAMIRQPRVSTLAPMLGGISATIVIVALVAFFAGLPSGPPALTTESSTPATLSPTEAISATVSITVPIGTLEGHEMPVVSLDFSRDGATLAAGYSDGTVLLWDVLSRGPRIIPDRSRVGELRVVALPLGRFRFATASPDGQVTVWQTDTGSQAELLETHITVPMAVAFRSRTTGDMRILAAGYSDESFKLWDQDKDEERSIVEGESGNVVSAAFSPDADAVAQVGEGGKVVLWDVDAEEVLSTLLQEGAEARLVAVPRRFRMIAVLLSDTTLSLWHGQTGQELAIVKGYDASVASIAFSSDGNTLAAGLKDGNVMLWDVSASSPTCLHPGEWVTDTVQPGATLLALAQDHAISVADVKRANCLADNLIFGGEELYFPPPGGAPPPTSTLSEGETPPTATSPREPPEASPTATVLAIETETPIATPAGTPTPPAFKCPPDVGCMELWSYCGPVTLEVGGETYSIPPEDQPVGSALPTWLLQLAAGEYSYVASPVDPKWQDVRGEVWVYHAGNTLPLGGRFDIFVPVGREITWHLYCEPKEPSEHPRRQGGGEQKRE